MISSIFKVIILVMLLLAIAWVGVNIYSCVVEQPNISGGSGPKAPDMEDARFSVYIENTHRLMYADDMETHGTVPGKRIFILHSFWEASGQKFIFKDGTVMLDESIFGIITVKRR